MAVERLEELVILASPIPPPEEGEALNADQFTTLFAIADAFIPAIQSSSSPSTSALSLSPSEYTKLSDSLLADAAGHQDADVVSSYLSDSASSTPGFKDLLNRMLGDYSRPAARNGASLLLSALGYSCCLRLRTRSNVKQVETRQFAYDWIYYALPFTAA